MADSRCWTKDFVKNFINSYQEQECLWNVKSKNYTNKNLKNAAYDKLVDFCKPIFPEANREFVQRKIQSLRGSFRKEMRKVLNSNGSYTSALWYFKLLLFTMNQDLPSGINMDTKENQYGQDAENHCNDEIYDVDDCDRSDNCSLDEPDPLANTPAYEQLIKKEQPEEPIKIRSPIVQKKLKRNIDMTDVTYDFMKACSSAFLGGSKSADVQEYEATGICVAKKLQRMDPLQTIYAESLINTVLNQGLLKTLGPHTDLCNNQCNARV